MTGVRVLALALVLVLAGCREKGGVTRLEPDDAARLIIYSTTDTEIFKPVIDDFRRLHPNVKVSYVELDAKPLFDRFMAESRSHESTADILISSSMDMQVKLANDGYAAPHSSANTALLPRWARWRNEAFGLTFEPVVMVYNTDKMAGRKVPQSRLELVNSLRQDAAFWQDKVGTYDIRLSNAGYLLATQDARQSSEFGPLSEAMGDVSVRTFPNTSTLLSAVEAGSLSMAYNVLGSYAKHRIDAGARLTIVYPEDYTLAIVRTALIPRSAPNPAAAHSFLEFLLSLQGQRTLSTRSNLTAVREEVGGHYGRLGPAGAALGPLRPIPLGPGLLVYLDRQKRERFLDSWQGMVEKHPRLAK